MSRWQLRMNRFLRVKPICEIVWKLRFIWFVYIRRQLRSFEQKTDVLLDNYSLKSLLANRPSDRILKLIMPLSIIDVMTPESRILSIGCRYEWDMLCLCAYGFDGDQVRGLDMHSYSPWIDLGNMHAMDYPDNRWDAVLLGWVISYSDDPQKAAREVVRVTRPGGLVAIGVTYYPPETLRKLGELELGGDQGHECVSGSKRLQTTAQLLALFGEQVDRVYFRHDGSDPARQSACVVVFSVRK